MYTFFPSLSHTQIVVLDNRFMCHCSGLRTSLFATGRKVDFWSKFYCILNVHPQVCCCALHNFFFLFGLDPKEVPANPPPPLPFLIIPQWGIPHGTRLRPTPMLGRPALDPCKVQCRILGSRGVRCATQRQPFRSSACPKVLIAVYPNKPLWEGIIVHACKKMAMAYSRGEFLQLDTDVAFYIPIRPGGDSQKRCREGSDPVPRPKKPKWHPGWVPQGWHEGTIKELELGMKVMIAVDPGEPPVEGIVVHAPGHNKWARVMCDGEFFEPNVETLFYVLDS